MRAYVLQIVIAILLATGLASCARKPPVQYQQNIFEVTEASITLSRGADPDLKYELQRRLDAAIAISHRGAPMPRVYLDVAILNTHLGQGGGGFQNTARVQVIARRPETNEPVHLREFESVSYTSDRSQAYLGLAESIASRIRFEFALATPEPQDYAPPPQTSTRLEGEQNQFPERPRVLEPRAGGDPLLNANTRFGSGGEIEIRNEPSAQSGDESGSSDETRMANEPCVVTAENDCSAMLNQ